MSKRIEQLDSLRGLAALSVFTTHIHGVASNLIPHLGTMIFALPPFKTLVEGQPAVMLFFVLSGFVLSLPFLKNGAINYLPYLVKRIFRIYVPYLVAIFIAMILDNLFSTGGIKGLSNWFNTNWTKPPSIQLVLEHILLIGNIHSMIFDGVIWSLIQELRISLIFPFVILLVKRFSFKMNVLFCLFLSSITGLNNVYHFQTSNGLYSTYFHTFHFVALFVIGALLAKHKTELVNFYKVRNSYFKYLLLGFSIMCYSYSDIVTGKLAEYFVVFSTFYNILTEYGMALGASGFLILALGSVKVEKLLMRKPIQFSGRISYSLYLYHVPALLSLIYIFYGKLPLWLIFIISLVVSLVISTIAWYCVENPCMKLGSRFANRMKKKLKNNTSETKTLVNN